MCVKMTIIVGVLNHPNECGWRKKAGESLCRTLNPFPEFRANLRKNCACFGSGHRSFPEFDGNEEIRFESETSGKPNCVMDRLSAPEFYAICLLRHLFASSPTSSIPYFCLYQGYMYKRICKSRDLRALPRNAKVFRPFLFSETGRRLF